MKNRFYGIIILLDSSIASCIQDFLV